MSLDCETPFCTNPSADGQDHCAQCSILLTHEARKRYVKHYHDMREAGQARFDFVGFDDWVSRPDVTWLIKGWLPEDCIGSITGTKYLGKSSLMLLLGGCISTSQDFLGLPVKKTPFRRDVVICLGEGQSGMGQQARALLSVLGGEKPTFRVLETPFPMTPLQVPGFIRALQDREAMPAAIFFDAKADFYHGRENDEGDAEQFVKAMKAVRDEFTCVVMATQHTGHADKERGRGSSRFEDALEVNWVVTPGRLEAVKVKNASAPPGIPFEMRPVPGTEGAMPVRLTALEAATKTIYGFTPEQTDAAIAALVPGMSKGDYLKAIRKASRCDQDTASKIVTSLLVEGRIRVEEHGQRKDHYPIT